MLITSSSSTSRHGDRTACHPLTGVVVKADNGGGGIILAACVVKADNGGGGGLLAACVVKADNVIGSAAQMSESRGARGNPTSEVKTSAWVSRRRDVQAAQG